MAPIPNRADYQKRNYPVIWTGSVQEPWPGRSPDYEDFTVRCSSFNVFQAESSVLLPIDFGNRMRAGAPSGKHPRDPVVLPPLPGSVA